MITLWHQRIEDNESEGAALLTTMLVLLILTTIGISAINITSTELNIVRNDKLYKRDFYIADAGVNVESKKVDRGIYEVSSPNTHNQQLNSNNATYSVNGLQYSASVFYNYPAGPPKGYDASKYTRYVYTINAQRNVSISLGCGKIGLIQN